MSGSATQKNLRFTFGALTVFFLVWAFFFSLADFADAKAGANAVLIALGLCFVCCLVWRRLCRATATPDEGQLGKSPPPTPTEAAGR